jgi:CRISPR-associated endonuclease/helicase Cas3
LPGIGSASAPSLAEPQDGLDVWEYPGEAALSRRWAAGRPKKFMAGTIAVGTIDQALLGIIRVKHAHLRLASLMRHLLIVDEVHASDTYMSALLGELLRFHRAAGGHALLLSATLGAKARTSLLVGPQSNPPGLAEAIAAPYPALSSERDPEPIAQAWEGREKSVCLSLSHEIGDPEAIVRLAVEAAERNAKVIVGRNLRQDAVAVFDALLELAPSHPTIFRCEGVPTLHHGRFAREDRPLLDDAVERSVGRERPEGGLILIGTQTLEQSLDIDADYLITDLAPADVLLQRLGRLHRHERPRPEGFTNPLAIVLAPFSMEALLTRCAHGLGGANDPYPDLVGAEATRRLVLGHPVWRIPAMCRSLVENATHPEARDALLTELAAIDPKWREAESKAGGAYFAELQAGTRAVLDVDVPFTDRRIVFPEDEIFATRLGTRDLAIEFREYIRGPFGAPVRSFTLPSHWLKGVDLVGDVAPMLLDRFDGGFAFAVQGQHFTYDAKGLRPKS